MKFTIQREAVLQPLSQVIGVVERRQTLPVLANFLLVAGDGTLSVTGTDMEVELIAPIAMEKELRFAIREGGHTVGAGVVTEIIE